MKPPLSNGEDRHRLSQEHWIHIAAVSLVLGSLLYAGILFPFSVVDGLLGIGFNKMWVAGPGGSASLLFILAWGLAIAVTAGRVFGRTEEPGSLFSLLPGPLRRRNRPGQEAAEDGVASTSE